jgi:hypothetical protein
MFPSYDARFFGGRLHGEGEAEIGSVVEGRCEESAGVREEPVVGHSGGEKIAPVARGGGAEGDEAQDSISIDSAEGRVGERHSDGGLDRVFMLGDAAGKVSSYMMAIRYRDYCCDCLLNLLTWSNDGSVMDRVSKTCDVNAGASHVHSM